MIDDDLLAEFLRAREARTACVLATIAATSGSVPRAAGSKMLIYADGRSRGTIGGGKFEALVIEEAQTLLRAKAPLLKTYPLHEGKPDSFGAICGGEATVFFEPQAAREALYLIGGGHCSRAIATLAAEAGLHVVVIEDRPEQLRDWPDVVRKITDQSAPAFIRSNEWQADQALVMVSRNHEIDREALAAALEQSGLGYLGMIGSKRKVRLVFDALRQRGHTAAQLARVHAPLGLDIGADSPAEIAISAMAEILATLRRRTARPLRDSRGED